MQKSKNDVCVGLFVVIGLIYEWSDPDRFFGGIELMKAGKARKIIFTGGKMPWQSDEIKPEGEVLEAVFSQVPLGTNDQELP